MNFLIIAVMLTILPLTVKAKTQLINTDALPSKEVYGVADLTPLVLSAAGAPVVVLLELDSGDVIPPHATENSLRLLTVLSGDMSWGDGSSIDIKKESVYPAGSVLTLPAGVDHWLAARKGPVRLLLVVLDDEIPAPAVQKQME